MPARTADGPTFAIRQLLGRRGDRRVARSFCSSGGIDHDRGWRIAYLTGALSPVLWCCDADVDSRTSAMDDESTVLSRSRPMPRRRYRAIGWPTM